MIRKTERFEKTIPAKEFTKRYVDIPKFLKYCEQCEYYGKNWACPPFDFDPMDVWNSYDSITLVMERLSFDRDSTKEDVEKELWEERQKLQDKLIECEKEYPAATALSAGNCKLCAKGTCARLSGEPCRFPDRMRHSIESLGGDVGMVLEDLFDEPLTWVSGDEVPLTLRLCLGILTRGEKSEE
ncbi:MAG: DUF2284 domain-containing protein [Anaerovoracaceae bacterium]|jgi:predicted metal-binding protein